MPASLAEACRSCRRWPLPLSNMSLDRACCRAGGSGAVSASSRSRCFRRLKGSSPARCAQTWLGQWQHVGMHSAGTSHG